MVKEIDNPKKTQLLQTAKDLFWKFGIKRVTVEEICREAKVSKVTFYKFFKNKNEIAITVFENVDAENKKIYRNLMDSSASFSSKIKEIIKLKLKATEDISAEFVGDLLASNDPELLKALNKKAIESRKEVILDFENAAKKGEIRKDIKSEFLLIYLEKLTEMAADPKMIALYKKEQDLIMELTNFFFYGIGITQEE